jgi:hypothetical protein
MLPWEHSFIFFCCIMYDNPSFSEALISVGAKNQKGAMPMNKEISQWSCEHKRIHTTGDVTTATKLLS